MSEDPIEFSSRDSNFYRYVKNQTTLSIDPTGKYQNTEGNGGIPDEDVIDQIVGAAEDFIDNYEEMKDRNTIGADRYYHCMANCQASSRGDAGGEVGQIISDGREYLQGQLGDSAQQCQDDQIANFRGQVGGGSSASCSEVCAGFKVEGL